MSRDRTWCEKDHKRVVLWAMQTYLIKIQIMSIKEWYTQSCVRYMYIRRSKQSLYWPVKYLWSAWLSVTVLRKSYLDSGCIRSVFNFNLQLNTTCEFSYLESWISFTSITIHLFIFHLQGTVFIIPLHTLKSAAKFKG